MTTEHQTVKDQVLRHYHKMVLIREFEGESYRQYMQKPSNVFLHVLSVGLTFEFSYQNHLMIVS
jgi:TPP-dependent pyruvate/acetoin dehydrogenase alpha subunit